MASPSSTAVILVVGRSWIWGEAADRAPHRLASSSSDGRQGDTMSNIRVLVFGASIAGPALAHWLHRRGAEVTVVEQSPGLRRVGRLWTLAG